MREGATEHRIMFFGVSISNYGWNKTRWGRGGGRIGAYCLEKKKR